MKLRFQLIKQNVQHWQPKDFEIITIGWLHFNWDEIPRVLPLTQNFSLFFKCRLTIGFINKTIISSIDSLFKEAYQLIFI